MRKKRLLSVLVAAALTSSCCFAAVPFVSQAATVPSDGIIYKGHYYRLYTQNDITWTAAKAACEELGGHLLTITSEAEQGAVEKIGGTRVWIGGYRSSEYSSWEWVTGEKWEYEHWQSGEPNNSGNYVGLTANEWFDNTDKMSYSYSSSTGFICEWDNAQSLDLPSSTKDITNEEVPNNGIIYNNHYYSFVNTPSISWTAAKTEAERMGGHLVTITSEGEQGAVEKIGATRVWIGGHRISQNSAWEWVTGEKWDYEHWQSGEPNNSGNYVGLAANEWFDHPSNMSYNYSNSTGFICEWDNANALGLPSSINDITKEDVSPGGILYKGHYYVFVNKPSISWTAAKTEAERMGGHLVTITSEGEQGAVETIGAARAWIGAYRSSQNSAWEWVTGEKWDYIHFEPGEPSGNGNRVGLGKTQWFDIGENMTYNYSNSTGFICEYDNVTSLNLPSSVPDITTEDVPSGGLVYNNHYYAVLSISNISWTGAKTKAERMGGHLVTITSEGEQAAIEKFNARNAWIGASRDSVNSAWEWVTGEKWDYVHWMKDEPNGTGNRVGIDSGQWFDTSENPSSMLNYSGCKGFICEWETPNPTNPKKPEPSDPDPEDPVIEGSMYRLYNPNSGEHFYTKDASEKNNLVSFGWKSEGTAWIAPPSSSIPVYRVYNPNSGEHHYTMNASERDTLVRVGWRDEGIGWYSDENQRTPMYRLYNPNATGQYEAGGHHYTKDVNEKNSLIKAGWRDEGIGWYGR